MHAGRLIAVDTPQNLRHLAMGGEIVDLRTFERLEYRHVQQLQELPFIISRIVREADNEVRLIVDKASTAISKLVDWTNSQGLSVDSIHEFFPPFDDVFVTLIERQENAA